MHVNLDGDGAPVSGELDRVGHEIPHHRCHLKRGEEGGGGRKREKGGN